MLKIHECYAEHHVKLQIETTNNAFKITLPNINHAKEIAPAATNSGSAYATTSREDMIIKLFEQQDTITRKDIEAALNISQATAILILRKMVNNNFLVKEGSGKNLRYRLNR